MIPDLQQVWRISAHNKLMWASCHTHASVLLARTHIHAGMHWCVSNMTLHTGADPLRGYYEHAISGLHQREDGLIYARAVQSSADKLLKIEIHGTLCSFKDLHKHTLAAPKHTCCVRQPFKLRLLSLCPGLQTGTKTHRVALWNWVTKSRVSKTQAHIRILCSSKKKHTQTWVKTKFKSTDQWRFWKNPHKAMWSKQKACSAEVFSMSQMAPQTSEATALSLSFQ